jgi:hypothetical protein
MPIVVPRWSRGGQLPALLTGGNLAIAYGRTGEWRSAGRTLAMLIEMMQDYGWWPAGDDRAGVPHPQALDPICAAPAHVSIAHRSR